MTAPAPRPRVRRCAALLAGLALTACAAAPPEPAPDDGPAAASPVDALETARRPAPAAAARDYPEPAALADLGEPQVRAMLGEPAFVRRDPPAEIWQYRTDGCVLHLFFYADAAEHLAVRHLEARRPEGGPTEAGDCLRHVIDARPAETG